MHGLDLFSTSWFLATGVVLFAGFVRGTAGFGFPMVFTPVMLLIMEPKAVVPVSLLLALLSNIVVLVHSFRIVNVKRLLPMIIGSTVGVPLGVLIISVISPSPLKVLIGGITVFLALLMLLNVTPRFANERPASGIAGFLSGLLNSSTSLGGPPVVLFMHNQNWPKDSIHANLAGFFLYMTTISLIGLAIPGLVTSGIVLTAASLIPGLVIGVVLGMQAFKHFNERYFRVMSIVIVVCSGIIAVLSGFGIFS